MLASAAAAGTVALAAAGASLVADGKVDYAVTARLKAVLAPGGTRALFVVSAPRAASRDLFLLPDAVQTVSVIGNDVAVDVDAGYWGKAGVQAGVRVAVERDPSTLPASSADIALARGVLSTASDRKALLTHIARALAPGAVLVAVERLSDGGGLPWRKAGTDLTTTALENLLETAPGFGRVAVDVVGDGVAVVVAQRDATSLGGGGGSQSKPGGGKADVAAVVPGVKKQGKKKGKGFR